MLHRERMLLMTLVVMAIPVVAAAVTIGVPADQPTIQQGIDAASAGDTVLVAQDTYTGPLNRDLDFGGKNIVVESRSAASPRSATGSGGRTGARGSPLGRWRPSSSTRTPRDPSTHV